MCPEQMFYKHAEGVLDLCSGTVKNHEFSDSLCESSNSTSRTTQSHKAKHFQTDNKLHVFGSVTHREMDHAAPLPLIVQEWSQNIFETPVLHVQVICCGAANRHRVPAHTPVQSRSQLSSVTFQLFLEHQITS